MNQMLSSDFTTASLGELSRLPCQCVAIGLMRAVPFGARHPARQMLAGEQPALIVDGVAVGIVGMLAEHRDFARRLDEPHHAVVGNVGPDEIAPGREPGRALRPAAPVHSRSTLTWPAKQASNRLSTTTMSVPSTWPWYMAPSRFLFSCPPPLVLSLSKDAAARATVATSFDKLRMKGVGATLIRAH